MSFEVLAKLPSDCFRDLRHFERMCKPCAIEIAISEEFEFFPATVERKPSARPVRSRYQPRSSSAIGATYDEIHAKERAFEDYCLSISQTDDASAVSIVIFPGGSAANDYNGSITL